MENIAPSLALLINVRFAIESGEPITNGVSKFMAENKGDFSAVVLNWLNAVRSGSAFNLNSYILTTHQKSLIWLIDKGLKGASIHVQLLELEREMILASQDQLESFVALLPMKSMLPLLMLLFPAFLVLLIGPILAQLVSSLSV